MLLPLLPSALRTPSKCCSTEISPWHFPSRPPISHYHKKSAKHLSAVQLSDLCSKLGLSILLKSLQTGNWIKENRAPQIKLEYRFVQQNDRQVFISERLQPPHFVRNCSLSAAGDSRSDLNDIPASFPAAPCTGQGWAITRQ